MATVKKLWVSWSRHVEIFYLIFGRFVLVPALEKQLCTFFWRSEQIGDEIFEGLVFDLGDKILKFVAVQSIIPSVYFIEFRETEKLEAYHANCEQTA